MKTTNQFIESQQELGKEKADVTIPTHSRKTYYYFTENQIDTLIAQIIQNTGEELMRRVEGGRRRLPQDAKEIMGELGVAEEKLRNFGFNKAIDTQKKHITSITGVE